MQSRGMVLLSLVLFLSLVSSASWQYLQLHLRRQSLYVDVVSNNISNRYNLLRNAAEALERWPTAQELAKRQAADGIVWSFDIVQQTPFQWRLHITRPAWLKRLVERQGGEGVADYWQRTEKSIDD